MQLEQPCTVGGRIFASAIAEVSRTKRLIAGEELQKEIADRRIASGTRKQWVSLRNQGRSHGRPDSCRVRERWRKKHHDERN